MAVDPTVIPLGSILLIDGVEYIAEDTGGKVKGNVIDIYVHDESGNFGMYYTEVFIKK